jgi:hypothetical protein
MTAGESRLAAQIEHSYNVAKLLEIPHELDCLKHNTTCSAAWQRHEQVQATYFA